MQDLKLVPAKHNRSDGSWSDDDYDVVFVETGKAVGRIFRQTVAPGNRNEWFWSLDFFQALGRRPFYGHAESKEAAKQAFADRWRVFLETPHRRSVRILDLHPVLARASRVCMD